MANVKGLLLSAVLMTLFNALLVSAYDTLSVDFKHNLRADTTSKLPVFFFHGVTANASNGNDLKQQLQAQGHHFEALSFCSNECSVTGLPGQVELAIKQIRGIIAQKPAAFEQGYVFIGHSQGGAIARAVIEEMDDHKVHTFISLAGAQNGIFYGPQPTDAAPLQVFAQRLGPQMIPQSLFNFSKYSPADWKGKLQRDFSALLLEQPALQSKLSVFNLPRAPVFAPWAASGAFLPLINNISPCRATENRTASPCSTDHMRRKANFLKLRAAHFFASPADEVVSPWQSSVLGQYQNIASLDQLESQFASLQVIDMTETDEYTMDTYGLQTLHTSGRLQLHTVPGVPHSCWVKNTQSLINPNGPVCQFEDIFSQHIKPLFQDKELALY